MMRRTALTASLAALALAGIAVGTHAAERHHTPLDEAVISTKVPVCNSGGVLDVPLVPTGEDPCTTVNQAALTAKRDLTS